MPSYAVPGGQIGTLPTGGYQCDLPGGNAGDLRHRIPDEDFKVISASSYAVKGKRGTYLLTGKRVVITGGPFKGKKYRRASYGFLRSIASDGSDGNLRCVLTGGR
ncbi:MAG: hypothetical protein KUG65_00920 [Sphingomonadaceae bacterium]|nr:hypothetical protein [Sphingomonadaceae bacterium]